MLLRFVMHKKDLISIMFFMPFLKFYYKNYTLINTIFYENNKIHKAY